MGVTQILPSTQGKLPFYGGLAGGYSPGFPWPVQSGHDGPGGYGLPAQRGASMPAMPGGGILPGQKTGENQRPAGPPGQEAPAGGRAGGFSALSWGKGGPSTAAGAKGLLAGLWEYPNELAPAEGAMADWGLTGEVTHGGTGVHIFTHVEWRMTAQCWQVNQAQLPAGWVWADRDELRRQYAIPSALFPLPGFGGGGTDVSRLSYDPTHCTLCPRRCGGDRDPGKGVLPGCRTAPWWPGRRCTSGRNLPSPGPGGAGTVFFSGCSLGASLPK